MQGCKDRSVVRFRLRNLVDGVGGGEGEGERAATARPND